MLCEKFLIKKNISFSQSIHRLHEFQQLKTIQKHGECEIIISHRHICHTNLIRERIHLRKRKTNRRVEMI